MNRNCADRIINFGDVIEEFNGKYHQEPGNHSDEEGTYRAYTVAACRDCHKTGQCTVECHGDIRLSVTNPGENHRDTGCNRCSKVRCHKGIGGIDGIVCGSHRCR